MAAQHPRRRRPAHAAAARLCRAACRRRGRPFHGPAQVRAGVGSAPRQLRAGPRARSAGRYAGSPGAGETPRSGRSDQRSRLDLRPAGDGGGGGGARQRSLCAAQGVQERGGDRRDAGGASARWRRCDSLPGLGRAACRQRQAQRDRGGRAVGPIPARQRAVPRFQLRHHLRRRSERRHRALPRDAGKQPAHPAGRALSRRLRRPVSGRHHRHHAHGRHRRTDVGDARSLHARAQGAHRLGRGALSARHHRQPARRARAHGAVGGRPRLRPRHRPWRRQLSRRPRGAAADLQDSRTACRSRSG